jgi:hypothetical protein
MVKETLVWAVSGVILKIFAKPHSETSISRRKMHCSEMTRRRGRRRRYAKRRSFAVALFPKLALMGLGKAFMETDGIVSCVCLSLSCPVLPCVYTRHACWQVLVTGLLSLEVTNQLTDQLTNEPPGTEPSCSHRQSCNSPHFVVVQLS